jgi:hypothetical protein
LALTYYTAILVLIIGILGFIFAIGLKYILGNKGRGHKIIINEIIKNRIFLKYCILLIFLCSLFFLFSGDSLIKHAENTVSSVIQNAHDSYGSSLSLFNKLEILDKKNISIVSTVTPRPIRPYQNVYKFLRISPLNWQNLFILLIGFTFIISIYKKKRSSIKFSEEDINILVAMVPAFIVALAFVLVNYEQRSFCYDLFFMILILKIPKKIFKYVAISIIVFFLLTGYFENIERVTFFNNSEEEVMGSMWITSNLNGKILSDERFISLLIGNGYYNVTGFPDNSPFVKSIFYNGNVDTIKNALFALDVNYFITTKRMREQHILMLNFPQEPMNNSNVYEENFDSIYNNGDVIIYKID